MTSRPLHNSPVSGTGLGLRRAFSRLVAESIPHGIDFMEVAPENWIDVGGKFGKHFNKIADEIPIVCHGLSLNLGGLAPLDEAFIKRVRTFMQDHQIHCYSEHLSYCADEAHLYDLMPIPFTEEAVKHVSDRIQKVQDIVGDKIAVENVSYYAAPGQEMNEIDFINAVLETADCNLLLDVNNIYVNSINHGYDAVEFLQALPSERIAYSHIAGHHEEDVDLRVDTHGADVIDPVWDLLDKAYQHFGVFPTLLERDFNIPPLTELVAEASNITRIQSPYLESAVEQQHG